MGPQQGAPHNNRASSCRKHTPQLASRYKSVVLRTAMSTSQQTASQLSMFSWPFAKPKSEAAIKMAKEFVASTIKSHPVVVFSKTYCPYCTKAKKALQSVGLKVEQIFAIEVRRLA